VTDAGAACALVEAAAVASSFAGSVERAAPGPYEKQQQAHLERTAASFANAQAADEARACHRVRQRFTRQHRAGDDRGAGIRRRGKHVGMI